MVFQYPEHQLFAETVYEDVAFGPRNMGLPEDEVDTRIREALADVHLDFDTLSKRSPFELSGGQQRRVAFAGVLAMRPTTLALDEPVAGLDPASRTDFLDLIKQLHEQRNLTVVMVSHNMNDIALLADRMLVMHEGRSGVPGTPEEISPSMLSIARNWPRQSPMPKPIGKPASVPKACPCLKSSIFPNR